MLKLTYKIREGVSKVMLEYFDCKYCGIKTGTHFRHFLLEDGSRACLECKDNLTAEELNYVISQQEKKQEEQRQEIYKSLMEDEEKEIKKERKSTEKMRAYCFVIENVKKRFEELKIVNKLAAEQMGISDVRLSQILNGKREANGGELVNLLQIAGYEIK